jgi:predicted transposase/invertase (TIGR01784 family)
MSRDYDKIIKENIKEIMLPLARKVLNMPEPAGVVEIPDDLQYTIERKPDFLKLITDAAGNSLYILQLEFQTRDEPDMLSRMLFYAAQLYGKYKLPIKQYVFFIGNRPARMRRELTQEDMSFRFHVRNVVEVGYQAFLETSKPEEMVLAILGNLGNDTPEKVVSAILLALKSTVTDQLALGRFLRQLEVLSKLRNIQNEVIKQIEAMSIVYDLETDIRYLQGKQKGAEDALASGLIRGMKEGLQTGIKEGLQTGMKEGLQAGRQEAKQEDVRGLLRMGILSVDQIATALSVSPEFVLDVQAGRGTTN